MTSILIITIMIKARAVWFNTSNWFLNSKWEILNCLSLIKLFQWLYNFPPFFSLKIQHVNALTCMLVPEPMLLQHSTHYHVHELVCFCLYIHDVGKDQSLDSDTSGSVVSLKEPNHYTTKILDAIIGSVLFKLSNY